MPSWNLKLKFSNLRMKRTFEVKQKVSGMLSFGLKESKQWKYIKLLVLTFTTLLGYILENICAHLAYGATVNFFTNVPFLMNMCHFWYHVNTGCCDVLFLLFSFRCLEFLDYTVASKLERRQRIHSGVFNYCFLRNLGY